VNPATKLKAWAQFLREIRAFLDERGFFEVSTDYLVQAGAFESTLDPLKVTYSTGHCELHTSPEIEMKRALAETNLSIYQICKSFRDDPITGVHQREFTMLEFYRISSDYRMTIQDMKELLQRVAHRTLNFEEYTIQEAFLRATGIDLDRVREVTAFRDEIQRRQLSLVSLDDAWDDLFFKLMMEKVEPSLSAEIPTLLKDYPASLCALSKIDNRGYAERFEIYWHSMELCNGCTELDDLAELKTRYEQESRARRQKGKEPHPVPANLFQALESLPPCSGVAVGLDRLFKCLHS